MPLTVVQTQHAFLMDVRVTDQGDGPFVRQPDFLEAGERQSDRSFLCAGHDPSFTGFSGAQDFTLQFPDPELAIRYIAMVCTRDGRQFQLRL